jgi:hypothetical protein
VCNQISASDPQAPIWVILAATIIPLADATIVLGNGGPKSIALGVHGLTAAVMLMTSALLLIS